MKVLQISSARSIGGGEKHVVDLSNELSRRGHDVFAAVVPDSPLPAMLLEIPPVNIRAFPLRNAVDVFSAKEISKFVRENDIELINAHFAKDYPVAAIAARISGVPFVITRHVLFPMNRLHRIFLRDVRYVLAPSNAVAESLRDQNLFPDDKIVTIRYGLDVDNFPNHKPGEHSGFFVGSIGNLDPVKGFDVLIRAAKIVTSENPGVRFRIVGEDRSRDGHNKQALQCMIEELNLTGSVELAGWSNSVAEVLGEFDLFVSASRSESFGFVIAEAMLSGVPVIATQTEGAKEIISDPKLGVLAPVADADALATSILDLISHNERRDLLSKYGRTHIAQNFSLTKTVDETEALYLRVIGSR
jgi:glycosyltransferase involved in cell wall biosynthesis